MKRTGFNSIRSWGIAVACSLVNMVVYIPLRISAMLFVAFLHRYDTDRQNAALFSVIFGVLRCFAGTITGYLGELFELRILTAVGCFVASLGVGICYFAEDIIVVNVSLGFIYGIGYALSCTLLPQILKQHFTENIAIAVGITYLGSSIGGLVIIPATTMLLSTYGVSGTLLITSGVMLHGVPLAMLLRNPKYTSELVPKENCNVIFKEALEICENKPVEIDTLLSSSIKNASESKEINEYSANYINAKVNVNMKDLNEVDDTANNVTIKHEKSLNDYQQPTLVSSSHTKELKYTSKKDNENDFEIPSNCLKLNTTSICEKQNKYRRALKTFVVFKNPSFLVIMLCQSAHVYIVTFVFTTVIDIAIDKGIPPSQENFILMMLPLSETIGFTCLGWMTDKGYLSVPNFIAISFFLHGTCMLHDSDHK